MIHVLDQLLGLDVGHTVHTGDTITARLAVSHTISKWTSAAAMFRLAANVAASATFFHPPQLTRDECENVPNRQDATGLGEVGLLLDATDALLEDGRNLGRCGLLGICASLDRDSGGSGANLWPGRNMLVSSMTVW